MLGGAASDLRHAWRSLRRAPGFTFVAVASLGLGFALAAATLAVVNAYLLRSMPYPAADRLHHVVYSEPGQREPEGLEALDWSTLADVVELVDHSTPSRLLVDEGVDRREWTALLVGSDATELLGLRAATGRSLVQDDFREGAEPVALISHALWQSRYGGDAAVVSRSFTTQAVASRDPPRTFRIVGVLPTDFRYARDHARAIDAVTPLRFAWPAYMVRLRDGVPAAAAAARIEAVVRASSPRVPTGWPGVRLESIQARYVAGMRPVLLAVGFAVGIVLAIVCLNVGVLMLLRALRRQKDVAVRVALGAGSPQIARTLAAESGLICAAALILALVVTRASLALLEPLIEARLGRPAPGADTAISLDPTVLAVLGGLGAVIALSLSLLPLRVSWSRRLGDLMRAGRGGTDSRAMGRVRSSLVSLQVGASLALLIGCALMSRTVVSLTRTDLGYDVERVGRARIALPEAGYPDVASFLGFYDQLSARMSERPFAFALTSFIPFFEYPEEPVAREAGGASAGAAVQAIDPGYLSLMEISLTEGRAFTPADRVGGEPVVLVSESLTRRLWPEGRALGSRLLVADRADGDAPPVPRTVVGVVADVRQTHRDVALQDVYIPFAQAPTRYAPVYVRPSSADEPWLQALREAVAAIDPQVLVTGDVTGGASLSAEAQRILAGPKFLTGLLVGFSGFALLLALLGLYGVTVYAVRQREREIAVRVAVGATQARVSRLFLAEGAVVIGAGALLGLGGGAAVAKLLEGQLHGVAALDAATFISATALAFAGGLLAVWLPSRRAAADAPVTRLNES
jgi:predicted permease